jgi:hypothetical protein
MNNQNIVRTIYVIDMLFQNIVKRKEKFLGPPYGGASVGTTSSNEGCSAGAPHTAVSAPLLTPISGTPVKMLLISCFLKRRLHLHPNLV